MSTSSSNMRVRKTEVQSGSGHFDVDDDKSSSSKGKGSSSFVFSVRDVVLVVWGGILALGLKTMLKPCANDGATVAPFVVPKHPGWGPIHVYYGAMDHLTRTIPDKWWLKPSPNHQTGNQWFSQHGQDVAVAKILNFQKGGFFVDLASNDAVWASNTFSLEQNFDWKGICIEPNPIYWYGLSFRKCHVVGSIVGKQDLEEVQVTLSEKREAGPFGGIVGDNFDRKKATDAQPRYTASLTSILQNFGAPRVIDYISLDVEGAEEFIMKDFPFDQYQFKVLTVERPSELLQALFEKNGYKKAMDIKRGDTVWVHHTMYEQAQKNLAKNPDEITDHAVKEFPPGVRD